MKAYSYPLIIALLATSPHNNHCTENKNQEFILDKIISILKNELITPIFPVKENYVQLNKNTLRSMAIWRDTVRSLEIDR